MLALSLFHLLDQLSRREQRNVPEKKYKPYRWKFKIRKRKSVCSEMFDVMGDYAYTWQVSAEFHNKVPEAITCRAFNYSQLDFDARWWIFKAWKHPLAYGCILYMYWNELLHKKWRGQGNWPSPRATPSSLSWDPLHDDVILIHTTRSMFTLKENKL